MDAKTIFTKTAKGITQLNQRTQSLSRQETNVLKAIDGRSSIGVLSDKLGLAIPKLGRELLELKKEGLIKVFEVRNETPLSDFGDDDDDFDFTTPSKIASALKNSVAGFGPSKFRRAGVDEQVDRADTLPGAPDALIDEVEEIAAKIAERKKQEQAQRINADALAAARGAVQHAQAEARARAEREAQIRARLEVEANARKDAEARVIEEARRATAAAEAARKDLEAKLAEEARKREEYAASTKQLTEAQIIYAANDAYGALRVYVALGLG